MRSSKLCPAPVKAALFLTCILGVTAWCSTPATALAISDNQVTQTSATEKPPVLLADEIIRRLRRLGLNFTKTRVPNPYSPYGEIC